MAFDPGNTFHYSNPGFNLLELLIEKVTRRDFAEYMRNEILSPLEMIHSHFNWKDEWSSRIPTGYDLRGNPVPFYIYPYRASGGLLADISDIGRFVQAEMATYTGKEARVISSVGIQQLLTPQIATFGLYGLVADAYGFGHFLEILPNGEKAIWHGGQGHGWMTHFHAVPKTGDGIVILTNSQRSWPLIASVLNHWSRWCGFGPVQFGRISFAEAGLKVVIAIILILALGRVGQMIYQFESGKRDLQLSLNGGPVIRIGEFVMSASILGTLLWAFNQDYLFLSSIFPVGAVWLGWSLLLLALVLLSSALLPKTQTEAAF